MALAPLAHVLWTRVMNHDPDDPKWPDRDRFVLSCGHASILIYSMLYLTGYGLTLDDLKRFRQWQSRTAGHPEIHLTTGLEATTGPLGQGVANGVGMGLAERWLRSRFGPELVDHYTFVLCSDGDLEEGISHEAGSLAGHLALGRLIYVYDNNHISIDGPTELAYTDNVPERFAAYGWHTEDIGEVANDTEALEAAVRRAMAVEDKPSMISLRSHIGWPAPDAMDTAKAHGSPLGADEIAKTKEILGLPADQSFWVPDEVLAFYRGSTERGRRRREQWQARFETWKGDRSAWRRPRPGRPWADGTEKLPTFEPGKELATRRAINAAINASAELIPGLMAGSADLTENNGVAIDGAVAQEAETPGGNQIHFGIREHGMGGVMNGLALHGGVLPIGGTFFVFSDYMRPSVRLAALSQTHVIYSWTHDSIGLGEDGPTHQPVEQLAAMRAMPGLRVIRPADANETVHAWALAVESDGPTALILTRQNVPVLAGTAEAGPGVARGGYVLVEEAGGPAEVVLVGTGSEVQLCVSAAAELASGDRPVRARVVSLPSWDLFAAQDEAYRTSVLPPRCPPWPSRRPAVSVGSGTPTPASPSTISGPRPPAVRYWPISGTPRRTWWPGRGTCSKQGSSHDDAERPLRTTRPEPVARQPPSRLSDRREAPEARRPGDPGGHLQPHHLRQGHRERRLLRRAVRQAPREELDQRVLLGARDHRHRRRLGRAAARPRRIRRGRRLRLARGGAGVGPRHRRDGDGGPGPPRADPSAQPLREDPGHGRRGPRHPDHDRRGPQHQRHPDLQPRSLRRGHGGLCRRSGRRPGRRDHRPIGNPQRGLVLRQPGRHRGRPPTGDGRRTGGRRAATPGLLDARGTAAVAQAQQAYQRFLKMFSRPRWEALAAKGAKVQRPLWASTSTKNPAYPDLVYVDTLIGPDTVNTMPDETIAHFLDHGTVARTVDAHPAESAAALARLTDARDRHGRCGQDALEDEGVASFAKSFDELMQSLSDKANALAAGKAGR